MENRGSAASASSEGTANGDVPKNHTECVDGMDAVYTLPMTKRTDMLESSVRKIIAPILRDCPQECGIVSITEVELSSDLSFATILVSALMLPKAAMEFLESRKKSLQREMGKLKTHKTPQLRFRLDTRAEEGSRLDKLLQE